MARMVPVFVMAAGRRLERSAAWCSTGARRLVGTPKGLVEQALDLWRSWLAIGATRIGQQVEQEVERVCRATRVAARRDVNRLKAEIARLRERVEELQAAIGR